MSIHLSIHRMRKGEKIWHLVIEHVDSSAPQAKSIFEVDTIVVIKITVERKRKSIFIQQCKRCLKYNHTFNYCHVHFVCAF